MTPVLISAVASAIPLLQPLIEKAILGVEHALGAGTGKTKLDSVMTVVDKVAGALSAAGKIPGNLDEATILTLIETTVQALKSNGSLPGKAVIPTSIPAAGQAIKVSGTLTLG